MIFITYHQASDFKIITFNRNKLSHFSIELFQMSSNRSASSRRISARKKGPNKIVQSLTEVDFDNQNYYITVYLHVKSTKVKGSSESDISLMSRPFQHHSLSNMKSSTRWPDVVEKIVEVTKSTEFEARVGGSTIIFDSDLGVVGWKGRREIDDPPKILSKKASVLVSGTNLWQGHLKEFGTKIKNKEKKLKFIFIDMGIAVYENEIGSKKRSSNEIF